MEANMGATAERSTPEGMARSAPRERFPFDLVGWKAISDYMGGKSEKSLRRLRDRAEDPLPVGLFGGEAVALSSALNAWTLRNSGLPPMAVQVAA